MKIKQTILVFALSLGIGGFVVVPTVFAATCGNATTSIIDCENVQGGDNGVEKLLLLIINILTVGVGVAAVGGIVYGSIMYASAADSVEQTKKAMGIIFNVVIGLLLYAFMYALLNFIIPGGLFT